MAVEVKARWSRQWRQTDRRIRQEYRRMRIEPNFYSPFELPQIPDPFPLKHANGAEERATYPLIKDAVFKAIVVYAAPPRFDVENYVQKMGQTEQ